ncbi:tetratricopeptide repeat-containing sensor histidine kinase [Chitinophaga skermanii]|uniref:tetratricopeptide repeat-containing sensor histidine kinase n=1 Tax=Chitinophaga skermanii TaxID=331697 RepID=UPI0013145D59|nr:tetratricopeptide repeat protein [Chitinophaga skermanii]
MFACQLHAQDSTLIYHKLDSIKRLRDDTAKVKLLVQNARQFNRFFDAAKQENAFLQEGIYVGLKIRDNKGLAEAYNDLGTAKRNKSAYILALDFHTRALKNAEESKDKLLLAISYNNVGVDYRRLEDLDNAFKNHFKALQIAEEINDVKNICVATNSIGNIQLSAKKYEDAIVHFNQALALETKSNNKLGMAINYGNIGYAYEGLGQLDRAVDNYKKSLAANIELDNSTGMSICYTSLGSAYQKKKEYETAMDYLMKSLAVNDRVDDKVHSAENYLQIGKLLTEQHKFEEGRKFIHNAIYLGETWRFKSTLMEAYQALADNYKHAGDFEASLENMRQSLVYKDSLLNEKSATAYAQVQAIYDVDRKDNQIKVLQHEKDINQMRTKRNFAWLMSLAIILCVLVIGGYFYIRHRNLQNNKHTLQLELRSLRSQMNPHFIFNSLSSIHRYIWGNNQEEASDYLTKFSKLMRMILENSQHTFIPLGNELESLTLYLDLEALRCNNMFEYQVNVDDDVNMDEVLVPPLIIQPYVENAIWHGLVHRKEKGLLTIDVKIKGKLLYCTVTDNGIGRKKAMEIKEKKGRVHQSLGMTVTEGRIALIKKINNSKETNISIVDLYDENQEPGGTKVIIVLPVEFLF